jgi:hypothetical protein
VRRVTPYLVVAPFLAALGLAAWIVTDLAAVRVVSPFLFLAGGVVGFGLGRHRSWGDADHFSLVGVGLVALAVFCLPFVTTAWGRVGFPLAGVLGVSLAAYGASRRVGGGWGLTRALDDGETGPDRPWLEDTDDGAAENEPES